MLRFRKLRIIVLFILHLYISVGPCILFYVADLIDPDRFVGGATCESFGSGSFTSIQLADRVDRLMLCITFHRGNHLQVSIVLLLLPHFDDTVFASREQELLRFICFEHVDAVAMGG